MPKQKPTRLMQKTAAALFADSADEQTLFLDALLAPEGKGNAVVWTGEERSQELKFVARAELPGWIPGFIDRMAAGEKPGNTDAYKQGQLYSLDYSSVLTGSPLLQLAAEDNKPRFLLDLCAAPGGKSILASRILRPEMLLSNEVEGKRLGILRHNLKRCGITNAFTQKLRPADWADQAKSGFDLCLVDAPCSGQSLLAKGTDNPGCFHPSIVKGNARRQLRILNSAAETICDSGYLLYTTCTFSLAENERVIEKFLRNQSEFSAVQVPHLSDHLSPLCQFPAYRVYPHLTPGAGGFSCLLQKGPGESREPVPESLLTFPVG